MALGAAINIGALTWRERSIRRHFTQSITDLRVNVESVEARLTELDTTVPKKVIATIAPVTHAVRELQQQIGV